ncbi:Mitochondrial GTPase 1 [Parahypoxylon ruwenzoriense]
MAAVVKTAASCIAGAGSSAPFIPRRVFEASSSITRSYFLGHHAAALAKMREMLSNVGLVVECRDSRVPLTSTNPHLESALAGRDRIVVYTKSYMDQESAGRTRDWLRERRSRLARFHNDPFSFLADDQTPEAGEEGEEGEREGGGDDRRSRGRRREQRGQDVGQTEIRFTDVADARSIEGLLGTLKERAVAAQSLTGLRVLIVGMPNAGKSTLLNALRTVSQSSSTPKGVEKRKTKKAARTGSNPGVTRALSTPVRVVREDPNEGIDGGVYVIDTPGVFVPYVRDVESMLKLALVGCVKDGVVPAETVADYLLFRLNLQSPGLYSKYCRPTNDVGEFLDATGRRIGMLDKGGEPSPERTADWIVWQWRNGRLGLFPLDNVENDGLKAFVRRQQVEKEHPTMSMHQAMKKEKAERKEKRQAARQQAAEA